VNILADENIARLVVDGLKELGHHVLWIAEMAPGIADTEVIKIAKKEQCFLLTADKAFAAIAARESENPVSGIMLLRLATLGPEISANLVCTAISSRTSWANLFCILGQDGMRIRNMPI
jgi:predicted nuclease of predicted toxin-antitoxin system